jgi:hypothetical protein
MLRESFQDERGSSLVTAMSKKQRIQAALQGKSMDRLPFMFWHHFRPHGSPQRMAELTLELCRISRIPPRGMLSGVQMIG